MPTHIKIYKFKQLRSLNI